MTKATGVSLAIWIFLGLPRAACASSGGNSGIAWFGDSVSNAFISARTANKPILLYWGAKWCPPCQQLKHSVFARSDFIEKSKQFVAVYLDGDDRGARQWGDTFHIAGYPTVLILRPDHQEILRISGATDLSEYTKMLDVALADLRPISATINAVRASGVVLTNKDCERLAYNSWTATDYSEKEQIRVARVLEKASRKCVASSAKVRARLVIASTVLSATQDMVSATMAVIEDPSIGPQALDLIMMLPFDPAFFRAVGSHMPAESAEFLAAWVSLMDGVESNPSAVDSDKLNALAAKLGRAKGAKPGTKNCRFRYSAGAVAGNRRACETVRTVRAFGRY